MSVEFLEEFCFTLNVGAQGAFPKVEMVGSPHPRHPLNSIGNLLWYPVVGLTGKVPSGVEMVVTSVRSVGGPAGDRVCWRMTVSAGETKVFVVLVDDCFGRQDEGLRCVSGWGCVRCSLSVTNVMVFWVAVVGCDPSVVNVKEDDFLFDVFWYCTMNRI